MDEEEEVKSSYVEDVTTDLQQSIKEAISASLGFNATDFDINSTYSSFKALMEAEEKNMITLISSLAKKARTDDKNIRKLTTPEDKFDALCDLNDIILDRINHNLDDAAGLKKKDQELIVATLNVSNSTAVAINQQRTKWISNQSQGIKRKRDMVVNLITARNIQRPQTKFKDKIDNRNIPFVPPLKEKPHSTRPLAIFMEKDEDGEEHSCHPYETELENWQPTSSMLEKVTPQLPSDLKEENFHFINDLDSLQSLIETLKDVKEFAIDLEAHSYRSFQGFTCLIQISTRTDDYIIDSLLLRNELAILNEVFTNPKILKVLHGADSDIPWLQRDFSVYIVGMFDTGQAAKTLNLAHHSLAYLLKHYCHLDVNKKYQLADWRIRPLPQDMLNYAREDTHYLLYVYDIMKKELLEKDPSRKLLKQVFQSSRDVCLKRYEKPLFKPEGFNAILKRSTASLNPRQLFALKEIYAWRDKLARVEDESSGYILPNHMMLQISDVLPREQQGILACCNPIPPMVRQQLNELHQIILKARDIPIENKTSTTPAPSQRIISTRCLDYDSLVHLRHDLIYKSDSQNLNTLLKDGKGDDIDYSSVRIKPRPKSRMNSSPLLDFLNTQSKAKRSELVEKISSKFVSPYQKLLNYMVTTGSLK
ncbi:exosome component 10-like [Panonychus citri]|uniref:exosome component 10-like n=1 Tax=Panonychus citri TaxID=50023 RepID=UPI0023077342|nr:exosome component 10-like [Panonychus citri]